VGVILILLVQSCSIDHGLGPTTQGIRGTVSFQGTWPDSILEVRVAVFENYPVESFLDLSGYSESIPLLATSAAYDVSLAPGTYDFIAVACRKTASWDTSCVLGFYQLDDTPGTPASITLEPGCLIEGIDISVNFTRLLQGYDPKFVVKPLVQAELKSDGDISLNTVTTGLR
jgi:hypothetical protein